MLHLGLEEFHQPTEELDLKTQLVVGGKKHNVRVVIYLNGEYESASLGIIVKECIINLNKNYNSIISMSDAWMKQWEKKYPGSMENPNPIDSTKDFSINRIFISAKPWSNVHCITNKKYIYDTCVWFTCWNESGRGMDAYFYKGKLVAVEMTP